MVDVGSHPETGAPFNPVPRATDPWIKVSDLGLIEIEGPERQVAQRFFEEFGLRAESGLNETRFIAEAGAPAAVIYRDAAKSRFVGPTFVVDTDTDLDVLSAKSGQPVVDLELPGCPRGVLLTDPNGLEVKVAYFQSWRTLTPGERPDVHNQYGQRARTNTPLRFAHRSSRVLRLGHMVLGTPNWEASARFYIDTLGLIPSDVQALPDGRPAIAFLRCDRGDVPTDHHTFVVGRFPTVDLEHAAFEVPDLDELGMGGAMLEQHGFERAWGIGRHILGSQIFDYWFGPDGYKFEHFADGDLFDASHPTAYHAMSAAGIAQWAPPMPGKFIRPRLNRHELWRLVQSLLGRSSGFGLREMRLMKASMASKSLPS